MHKMCSSEKLGQIQSQYTVPPGYCRNVVINYITLGFQVSVSDTLHTDLACRKSVHDLIFPMALVSFVYIMWFSQ